jgi:hypothetical protein
VINTDDIQAKKKIKKWVPPIFYCVLFFELYIFSPYQQPAPQ